MSQRRRVEGSRGAAGPSSWEDLQQHPCWHMGDPTPLEAPLLLEALMVLEQPDLTDQHTTR